MTLCKQRYETSLSDIYLFSCNQTFAKSENVGDKLCMYLIPSTL